MGRAVASSSHNYPQLQNLIKRDAPSYREEFLQQYQHFKVSLEIIRDRQAAVDEQFESLVAFISHTSFLYAESKDEFPILIMTFLENNAVTMSISLRRTLLQSLLLLRKHNAVDLLTLLELFFRLLCIQDKAFRELLTLSIVSEIKRANKPHRNNALNKKLQNFMYTLFDKKEKSNNGNNNGISDTDEAQARHRVIYIVIELYRNGIWRDEKTVNVIAEAATSGHSFGNKVMVTALHFFIGRFKGKSLDDPDSDEDSSEGDQESYQNTLHTSKFNAGNKRSAQKKIKKALNAMHRKTKKSAAGDENGSFAAIHLLHDPQGFIEKLFNILKKTNDGFDTKLLLMNVISRVIGAHRLLLTDIYSFFLRYIQPHQKDVTQILAYTAQSMHDQLSIDLVQPVLKAIMHNFVAEYCANEVIAAGLNGIREICSRCPMAMTEDMIQDLSNFKGYQDKGVVMAARSLIGLFREINPELLSKRDRGKEVTMSMKDGSLAKKGRITSDGIHLDARIDYTKDQGQDQEEESSKENELSEEDLEELSDGDFEGEEISDGDFEGDEFSDDDGEEGDEDEEDDDEEDEEEKEEKEKENEKGLFKNNQVEKTLAKMEKEKSLKRPLESKIDIVRLASQKILSPQEYDIFRKRIKTGESVSLEGKDDDDNDSEQSDSNSSDSDSEPNEIIDPRSLESSKKSKQDYAARLAGIVAGREGRLKFGSRKGKHNGKSSTSNRIKEKTTKNALMLVHKSSVRAKKMRSLKERQAVTTAHRKKQKFRK